MSREQIIETIKPIARKVFSQPELEITEEMSAATLDSWTSLSFTQLLTGIEEALGFKFKMMEIFKMKDMGSIIEAIGKHIEE